MTDPIETDPIETDPIEARKEPVEFDITHPERSFELAPNIPKEWRELGWKTPSWGTPVVELCPACGWTTYEQAFSYLPRVRIFHTRENAGLWSLGSKWLLKDQPNDDTLGNEYMTWKFLHEQPGHSIPLVKEMRRLTDPEDPIQFTVISRAPGKPLASIWGTLSPEQKSGYRDQMVDILRQLRQFTAPFPQKVNGDKMDDSVLVCARLHPPTCFKVGFSEQEWLENLSETLRAGISVLENQSTDEELIEKKLQELKDNFPSGPPYTLTHGDLNLTNIIVKDDKIQAIIDWELSGYLPWWVERYAAGFADRDMHDLFEGVWERVHPDVTNDAFEVIRQKMKPVQRAIKHAAKWHESQRHELYRPPFSKCMPYGGIIRPHHLGTQDAHVLKPWRNGPTPDSIEWEHTVRDPRRQKELDQKTPVPTPSAASARWFKKAELSRQEK